VFGERHALEKLAREPVNEGADALFAAMPRFH
jgi:hypothetical protein